MGLAFATGALAAGETPDFKGQKDKETTSWLPVRHRPVVRWPAREPRGLPRGSEAGAAGTTLALSPEEAKAAHRGLQVQVVAQRHQEYLQQAEQDLEAGQAFWPRTPRRTG